MNNATQDAPESGIPSQTRWSTGRQSATALAAGLGLTLGTGAHAVVIYTDVNPDEVITNFGQSFGIDLDNDGTDDFAVSQFEGFGYYANVRVTGSSITNGAAAYDGGFVNYADALNAGDTIDGTRNFESLSYLVYATSFGEWTPDTTAYLGLIFDIAGESHFGWAQLSVTMDQAFVGGGEGPLTVSLLDYAYESCARSGITAGATSGGSECAVPEPGTVALLAMGALPLIGMRRRRRTRPDA